MLALIEMEDAHELRRRNWRKILTLMEEMKGETK
jgi:hypothetical protein